MGLRIRLVIPILLFCFGALGQGLTTDPATVLTAEQVKTAAAQLSSVTGANGTSLSVPVPPGILTPCAIGVDCVAGAAPCNAAVVTMNTACSAAATANSEIVPLMGTCLSYYSATNMACFASSPNLLSAFAIVSGMTSMAQGVGLLEACKMYKSGMDKVKGAVDLYLAACGIAQKAEASACTPIEAKSDAALVATNSCLNAANAAAAACKGVTTFPEVNIRLADAKKAVATLTPAKTNFIASNAKRNASNTMILAAGGFGLIQLMANSGIGKKCDEQNSTVADESIDCTKDKYKNEPTCICRREENNPACNSKVSTASASAPPTVDASQLSTSTTTGSTSLNLGTTASRYSSVGGSGSSSGSGSGAAGGSGGGASGGSSGSGSGRGTDSKTARTSFNPNILGGGADGGGGGGFRSGGGGSSDPALAKALAAATAQRNPASAIQVDKSGSRDIFEKVHDTAGSLKPTLFGIGQ